MNASVVRIDSRRVDQTSFESPNLRHQIAEPGELESVVVSKIVDSLRSGIELSVKQLYSELTNDSRLLKALSYVERARLSLRNAIVFDPSGDFISFDQELITARSLLLLAFRFREIGDGYAAVINASIWAITNRGAEGLSKRQVNVIIGALERVSDGPLLHFDTAMQVLDELEAAELDLEPPTLDLLTDGLDV